MTVALPKPWHQAPWQQALGLIRDRRLPHGLLLAGPEGVGKQAFAEALVQYLLCQRRQDWAACGQCKSCQLLAAGTHPDLFRLEPEEEGKALKVDQVRELVGFAAHSAQFGGYRVVVIRPADALNVQSANALLKTLEEPGRDTVILLLTDRPLSLLATIRSRCQQWPLAIPASAEALDWLAPQVGGDAKARLLLSLAGGAPLRALAVLEQSWFSEREALLKDMLEVREGRQPASSVAQRWQKVGLPALLASWRAVLPDVAKRALSAEAPLNNSDLLPIINRLAAGISARTALEMLTAADEAARLAEGNVNSQLLIENLWLHWAGHSSPFAGAGV